MSSVPNLINSRISVLPSSNWRQISRASSFSLPSTIRQASGAALDRAVHQSTYTRSFDVGRTQNPIALINFEAKCDIWAEARQTYQTFFLISGFTTATVSPKGAVQHPTAMNNRTPTTDQGFQISYGSVPSRSSRNLTDCHNENCPARPRSQQP